MQRKISAPVPHPKEAQEVNGSDKEGTKRLNKSGKRPICAKRSMKRTKKQRRVNKIMKRVKTMTRHEFRNGFCAKSRHT